MIKLFLVGVPRSGTTLLQSMIYSSGQVYSMPETHAFRLGNNKNFSSAYYRFRFLNRFGFSRAIKGLIYKKEFIYKIIEEFDSKSEGYIGWLEKTPDHLFNAKEIYEVDNSVKFILIERDYKDNIASLKDMWESKEKFRIKTAIKNTFIFLRLYLECESVHLFDIREGLWLFRAIDHYRKAVNYINNNDYLFFKVSYEDLVNDAEKTLKNVCDEINIDYSNDMLNFEKNSCSLINEREVWKSRNRSNELKLTNNKYNSLSMRSKYLITKLVKG
ncbi:sulfotransferase family protein [Vibrio maerlii]|uniref:sulfotransferase family protein n=1 Tax=Vibrio maerlii TaxID=2231648 RepID=UPI000E3D628A|nr:sulfotransferase [Vibrio maerlii]